MPNEDTPVRTPWKTWRAQAMVWLASTLIVAATIAAYSNSLDGPFLYDDIVRIANDATIRTLWPPWSVIDNTNRPVAMLTFAINYSVHQDSVYGYHITNLAIHILAALVLLGLYDAVGYGCIRMTKVRRSDWLWRYRCFGLCIH